MNTNEWMEKFGGTRNQVRRIVLGAPHNKTLDGDWGEYRERFQRVSTIDWDFPLVPLLDR